MAGGARVRGRPHRDDAVRGVSQHHARILSPEAGVSFGERVCVVYWYSI